MSGRGLPLAGVTALVTGAAGGIGRALVDELLARGAARVHAAARRDVGPWADARVSPLVLDITDAAAVREAAARCTGVQLLVNNAGVNRNASLLRAPDLDAARAEMETNYFGTLAMCRAFAPVLAGNGGGCIVNVLSIAAEAGMPPMGSLCASKAAALRMTECLRAELAGQGTQVMAALPSAVDTAMTRHLDGLPKLQPAEVARAICDGIESGQDYLLVGAPAEHIARRLREDRAGMLAQLGGR
ncbi:SDR family NAD(P)-dependent oxidoreductase [Ramlibacter sp.]|uniref:SDR family NAD(P)-dependent oxidoreductase n=1 Tax=Ramlibacter sp. TaxID=1917967 RepID=UPI002D5B769A|nr:SDR family NAD(P)-dependent oxidoreductase [Ramlibacter sp.]HYD75419.1 SDR family NAD(P)-dependent oxidoreductase [Ramlibacter sp.]